MADHRNHVSVEIAGVRIQRNVIVRFRLQIWNMQLSGAAPGSRLFYECDECPTGCGCPSFEPNVQAVPEDVLHHLRAHVALRH
jgi:hypothetical protein